MNNVEVTSKNKKISNMERTFYFCLPYICLKFLIPKKSNIDLKTLRIHTELVQTYSVKFLLH